MGARAVFLADPNVGGRYSALSAFGLVPSALAGVDVGALLDEAEELAGTLADPGNAALELGIALGAGFRAGRDKLALAGAGGESAGADLPGFGDWAEQLIAESTGKEGRGILPVVLESVDAPGSSGPDVLLAVVGSDAPGTEPSLTVAGPLGAQFLGWEYATAVAGRILGINPFDQPNVTESKENTQRILGDGLPDEQPAATIGAIEVRGSGGVLDGVDLSSHDGVSLAVDALLAAIPRAATWPSWPTSTVSRTRAPRTCGPRSPGGPSGPSPSAGARVSCTPPGSTTRVGHRSAPSSSSPGSSMVTCPCPASRSRSGRSRPPRPPATARRWPTATVRCCTCT
ncbi:hypothetical protein [Blastococcus brunescens]|uniref:Uncharacterized protein n=1 Tax=Blastococcus brunescens TaxID=1564165 RepID=A0ABZ1AYM0_9ACTN|nr:hypothetical protein [Blastococcus sp. BMG 8361]WRL61900.1 hypothetical protein U6N30_17510 [Blastococcus sp. BMG 8361]